MSPDLRAQTMRMVTSAPSVRASADWTRTGDLYTTPRIAETRRAWTGPTPMSLRDRNLECRSEVGWWVDGERGRRGGGSGRHLDVPGDEVWSTGRARTDPVRSPSCPLLEGLGLDLDDVRADARMVGTSPEAHLGSKATSAALAAGFAILIGAVLAIGGLTLPIGGVAGLTLVLGTVGFFTPDLKLRTDANHQRRDFAIAFGSYLDLVAISLAGGMGTKQRSSKRPA